MPAPTTTHELLELLRKSELLNNELLNDCMSRFQETLEPAEACQQLMNEGVITAFHRDQLMKGKYRGFFLGKYKLLDRIGFGGMGQVFLAEHGPMRRQVALKVLPPDRAENQYSRERFLREARAVGQLDHPNLVRAYDVDAEGDVIFLVMEFVDGVSFQDLVTRIGALPANRAAHYLFQAARGLEYLNQRGLIHRDIKPANLLVDRQGVVKILDLGLVRAQSEDDNLTRGEGVKILGTADYLSPEQAIDCSTVDVRADIYSLGATAYFMMAGRTLFSGDKVAHKLIAHQVQAVTPLHKLNPMIPQGLSDVILKMLAKKPGDRYQTAGELIEAIRPWATEVPAPPTDDEIPKVTGTLGMSSSGTHAGHSSGRGLWATSSSVSAGSGSKIRYNLGESIHHNGAKRVAASKTSETPTPGPSASAVPDAAMSTPPKGYTPLKPRSQATLPPQPRPPALPIQPATVATPRPASTPMTTVRESTKPRIVLPSASRTSSQQVIITEQQPLQATSSVAATNNHGLAILAGMAIALLMILIAIVTGVVSISDEQSPTKASQKSAGVSSLVQKKGKL